MSRKKKPPSVTVTEEVPPRLSHGEDPPFRTLRVRRGIAGFSLLLADRPEAQPGSEPGDVEHPRHDVFWPLLRELDEDHGLGTAYGVLIKAGILGGPFLRPQVDFSELEERLGEEEYMRLSASIEDRFPPEDRDSIRDTILTAAWAEHFAETYGPVWLAAMSLHAAHVEQNYYAFGYLTALLDMKNEHEVDALRGKVTLSSASQGGATRASAQRDRSDRIVAEMERLIAEGHTVSNAARLSHRSGLGASPEANRKIWGRHRRK